MELQRALRICLEGIEGTTRQPFARGLWNDVTFIPVGFTLNHRTMLRTVDLLAGRYHAQTFATSDVELHGVVLSVGGYLAKVAIARVQAKRAAGLVTEARRLYIEFLVEYLCLEHPELGQRFRQQFTVPRKAKSSAPPLDFESLSKLFHDFLKV